MDRPHGEIDTDIEHLDAAIRQLKIQYDMFFSGAIPKQPLELRADIERIIKHYSNAPIRKYAQRFHFNSLASRFSSLSELWSKSLKNIEEGGRPAPPAAARPPEAERILLQCRVRDPIQEQEVLKVLHARFLDARRKAGEKGARVTFESFVQGIASQAERIRSKSGCGEVELRLVLHERKVLLKARPGR